MTDTISRQAVLQTIRQLRSCRWTCGAENCNPDQPPYDRTGNPKKFFPQP